MYTPRVKSIPISAYAYEVSKKEIPMDVKGSMKTPELDAYRARDERSLEDAELEAMLFNQIDLLERLNDNVGPTPLRHKLSELIVQMRREIWAFDQRSMG